MYDLHNHALLADPSTDLASLGIQAAGVVFTKKYDSDAFKKIKTLANVPLFSAFEIKAEQAGEVRNQAAKQRGNVDVIFVHAKDPRAMRAAAESKYVDVMAHAFIDQTAAREMGKNQIALEVNLRDILQLYGIKRATHISKVQFSLGLARKYNVPLLLTTGAHNAYELRSPRQIQALAECIGFTPEEAKKALYETPKAIIQKNQEQRQGMRPTEDIKIVKS